MTANETSSSYSSSSYSSSSYSSSSCDLSALLAQPVSSVHRPLPPPPWDQRPDDDDALDALLTEMGTHLAHGPTQTQCLSALTTLANLASHDDESSESSAAARAYAVDRGALTLTAAAMRHHPQAEDVQAAACQWLATVYTGSSCAGQDATATTNDMESRTQKAGRKGGLAALVVQALQDHRGSGAVARHGCAALAGLALVAENDNDAANCETMGEEGGIDAVVDVLGRCGGGGRRSGPGGEEETTTLVDQALVALHNWTVACKPNRDRLARRHGSVATILAALRGHEDHERIATNGLGVIRQLVEDYTTCADGCARCGGAAVLLRAMECHPNHVPLQTHGVALVRRLASTDPRRVELGMAGAVERTAAAMGTFPTVREVQFQAAAALHNLSIESEPNGDRVGAAGGMGTLLRAMEAFEDDEQLVAVCCRTLHRLSYVGTNKRRIRGEDPTHLLVKVSQRYPKSCGRTAKGVLKNV